MDVRSSGPKQFFVEKADLNFPLPSLIKARSPIFNLHPFPVLTQKKINPAGLKTQWEKLTSICYIIWKTSESSI